MARCAAVLVHTGVLSMLLPLLSDRIIHVAAFMKPVLPSLPVGSCRTGDAWCGQPQRCNHVAGILRGGSGRTLSGARMWNRGRPLSASSSGDSASKDADAVVYAQDVLDRAWRSKRRQGKSNQPLKNRFLSVIGAKQAQFVDDRDFMDNTLDNVVRVYCTHTLPSWSMPWQRLRQEQSTSTGFIIDGRRIITNAHSVEYSTMIQIRARGSDKKFQATRYAVGEECDLAILTVEDEDFWRSTSPLPFGDLPQLTDQVSVIGYPVGGECISITAGVVSRVEMTLYAQAEQKLLSIQIDAAINPGNSGGPVVNDNGEVVGVAFQSLDGDDVENIGYVVPVNVLEHFLEDVRRNDGAYKGFPLLGIMHARLESPALRQSLRMTDKQTGVLVTRIEPTSGAMNSLRKGDVIMKVDGISVANDGTIPFRAGERVSLRYYISQLFCGDEIVAELWRDNRVISASVPLSMSEALCPAHFSGRPPSYFVLGGLVFTIMSTPYLEVELDAQGSALAHLLSVAEHGQKQTRDEEIVVLTQVLAHNVNVGYQGMSNLQLKSFNGTPVRNLAHLVRLVDENSDPFLSFDLFPDRLIVLDSAAVAGATEEICEENSIPASRSLDLRQDFGRGGDGERQFPVINGAPQPTIVDKIPTLVQANGPTGPRANGRSARLLSASTRRREGARERPRIRSGRRRHER